MSDLHIHLVKAIPILREITKLNAIVFHLHRCLHGGWQFQPVVLKEPHKQLMHGLYDYVTTNIQEPEGHS